jgi:hypothetical protein
MWHDDTRPALASLAFKDHALVATDGYVLVAMDITADWRKEYEGDEFGDYVVPKQVLKDWCKTHTSKAEISVEELWAMAEKSYCKYPDWRKLADVKPDKDLANGIMPQPTFDPSLLKVVVDVFLDEPMTMGVYGSITPLKLLTKDNDIALIMPMHR